MTTEPKGRARPRARPRLVSSSTEDALLTYLRRQDEYLQRQDEQERNVAAALNRLAAAAESGVADVKPALEFFGDAGRRLDALCSFLRKWGPWFLAAAPGVAMLIGAVTPNAAQRLNILLTSFLGK